MLNPFSALREPPNVYSEDDAEELGIADDT